MELEIIAHRGYAAITPENTLMAFARALHHGADSIEFDLQLSADGMPIIFHDKTLERIMGSPEKVRDKTWQELQKMDAGSWFNPQFREEKIPDLEGGLTILKKVKKYLYFDVKTYDGWSMNHLETLVEILKRYHLQSQGIITSFNDRLLEDFRQITSDFSLGYIVGNQEKYLEQLAKAVKQGNCLISSEYHILLDKPELVKISQDQGIDLVVWTVDDPEDLKRLIDLGLTRIVSNSLIELMVSLRNR